jgi:hypothetical protein
MRRLALAVCLFFATLMPAVVHANAASPWTPGPGAGGDDTYTGFIDSPAPGTSLAPNAQVNVQGWIVDQTAVGWSGIDQVQVYVGQQDQGGTLLANATVGIRRDDVAAATGNGFWLNSGFSASFQVNNLPAGGSVLTIYAHTPDKGWWYRQVSVSVPAPPDRAFADDPLLVLRTADPSLDVPQSTQALVISGYAIDRNLPLSQQLGVGGSGVSTIQAYLDGPRNGGAGAGALLASATMGIENREATGFGQRFHMSGFQITVHPRDLTVDRHELYIYAESAFWPSETLVIVPFTVH